MKLAISEINDRSDLEIDLLENRDAGRSVKYLQFRVQEKQVFRLDNEADHEKKAKLDKRLEDYGLKAGMRSKILATHNLNAIEAAWQYTVDPINDKTKAPLKTQAHICVASSRATMPTSRHDKRRLMQRS